MWYNVMYAHKPILLLDCTCMKGCKAVYFGKMQNYDSAHTHAHVHTLTHTHTHTHYVQGMRRVSFSDSSLHTEHFYPKYDYSDYDEIEQELPDIFGRGKLRNVNTGLSHRLHPSLRTDNDTNSDSYRYGFNSSAGGNPSSPSPSSSTDHSPSSVGLGGGGGLSSYKPSMLSSFDSLGTFSHLPTPTLPSPIKEEASAEADADSDKVDGAEDDSTDFYSTLNADTAALLW